MFKENKKLDTDLKINLAGTLETGHKVINKDLKNPEKNPSFGITYIIKYFSILIFTIASAAAFGRGLGALFKSPLFFIDSDISVIIFVCISFIALSAFLFLIGILFSNSYRLLFLTAFLLCIVTAISTALFDNLFILVGFGFGLLLVYLLYFINVETDVSNQFTFRFFQALRSSHVFIVWLSLCISLIYGIALLNTLGATSYTATDVLVNKGLSLVQDKSGVDFTSYNKSLQDAEKRGDKIDFFLGLNPTNSELLLTPKEFLRTKLSEVIKSNSLSITFIITALMFLILISVFNILTFISKLFAYAIFKILLATGFCSLVKIQREATVLQMS